jgi:hypothetical protein
MTDHSHNWEIIASRDPYFGVIASDHSRIGAMVERAKARFYASGESDIATLLAWFNSDLGARPRTGAALEIGCGVGRLSYAMPSTSPWCSATMSPPRC